MRGRWRRIGSGIGKAAGQRNGPRIAHGPRSASLSRAPSARSTRPPPRRRYRYHRPTRRDA
ncbi:hypothetical protein XF14_02875 [Burkholderia gladioli]|nr:hypothetical protein XF14_02875 [Burkholderia gladioli]